MSIISIPDIMKDGWGLENEDLDKIIKIEGLRDVTQDFLDQIRIIRDAFGSVSNIRIVAFSERSGVNHRSKEIFNGLIRAGRDIFHHNWFSNRECCVVLIHNSKGKARLQSYKSILAHEYAHHFQWAYGGFPFYISKGLQSMHTASFIHPHEIGPEFGLVHIDGLLLPDMQLVIQDSNERISDVICEGLLREKGLVLDLLERYKDDVVRQEDPADCLPQKGISPNLKRYVRRLALRDQAEWGACVQQAYPKQKPALELVSKGRKFAINMNKKYSRASGAYDEISYRALNTDFNKFRLPENVVSYTKGVLESLSIRIKTSEKW
jgi:hypothetical protein